LLRHIRLIITDLDQALFDSHELRTRAFRQALATASDLVSDSPRVPDAVDLEDAYLIYGHSWPECVDVGLGEPVAAEVGRLCQDQMVRFVEAGRGRLQPGVLEYLLSCRESGTLLAIGAEAERAYLLAVCDRFCLSDVFECVLCTGEYGASGADEMFEDILARCEALAGETVYVGARPDTLDAARFLGIRSIVSGWGVQGGSPHLREEPCAADIQALSALIAAMDAQGDDWVD